MNDQPLIAKRFSKGGFIAVYTGANDPWIAQVVHNIYPIESNQYLNT